MSVSLDWAFLFAVLTCLLYGGIPFPLIITYHITGIRLDRAGTNNIGIANAFGAGGLLAGLISVTMSASQAALPIIINNLWLKSGIEVSFILLLAVIIGAQFSFFAPRNSINGGTILIWGLLFLSPFSALLFGIIFGLLFILSKNTRLTTIFGYLLLPAEIWLIERSWPFVLFGLIAALLFAFRYNPRNSEFHYYHGKRWLLRLPSRRLIIPVGSAGKKELYGSKAVNLRRLQRTGARVPMAWVCCTRAYQRWQNGDKNVDQQLMEELASFLDFRQTYAVRSSSSSEDGDVFSFAGQFESHLNLQGVMDILAAVHSIWDSATGDRVMSYLKKTDGPSDRMTMAVIIQEMVDSRLAGAVFTRNPMTGLNETIVEAVDGSGEALMQQGVTPKRWVFKWGQVLNAPDDDCQQRPIVEQVVEEAKRLDIKIGTPLDLEWAWDGKHIYWLQARSITSMKGNIYSNRISREFMPGMIKPLVWSVNTSVVNTAWKDLFHELIGHAADRVDIHNLAKPFYYRSFFNMGVIGDILELLGMPRESLELLLGIEVVGSQRPRFRPGLKALRFVPLMLAFTVSKLTYVKRARRTLPSLMDAYKQLASEDLSVKTTAELMDYTARLTKINVEGSYHVIISRLLASLYHLAARRLAGGKDLGANADKKLTAQSQEIDPAFRFNLLKEFFLVIPHEQQRKEALSAVSKPQSELGMTPFEQSFSAYMAAFGHLSDSGNDFSRVQWKENPQTVADMLTSDSPAPLLAGKHKQTAHPSLAAKTWPHQKAILFRAAEAQYVRALANFTYEYGYSLFRQAFLEFGWRLVTTGQLGNREDVFYLYLSELHGIAGGEGPELDGVAIAKRRREEMQRFGDVVLPEIIIGEDLPMPVQQKELKERLKGVPVSRGYHEGRLRVLNSIPDFTRVDKGDVVVIPYSDISWTPLLGKAGAIVSESGGMLSHCSIVAREFGIPAVVSVNHAMALPDGSQAAVDGLSGEIWLL